MNEITFKFKVALNMEQIVMKNGECTVFKYD